MPKVKESNKHITVLFHALRRELCEWSLSWCEEWGLHGCGVSQHPEFNVRMISDRNELFQLIEGGHIDELWLNIKRIKVSADAKNIIELERVNRGSIMISLPDYDEGRLRQTLVGAEACGLRQWNICKLIKKDIFSRCHKGLWIVNETVKVIGFSRKELFSDGVRDAVSNGLVLLPFAGDLIMRLDNEGYDKYTLING